MARKKVEEEHTNHERWMVTYADMLTLLFVLFVVLYAMSQVDEAKYAALKEGLSEGFGMTAVMQGSDGAMQASSIQEEPQAKADSAETFGGVDPQVQEKIDEAVSAHDRSQLQHQYAEAQAEAQDLTQVWREISAALQEKGLQEDVQAVLDERGLVISLVSKHIVFEPNLASLSSRGREVVDTMAPVLRRIQAPLEISGHTNQVDVKPKYYDTDWDLSSARAITVLRYLHESRKVPQERLRLSAFGHEKPLVDPAKKGSQDVNKRVDIVVLSSLAAESRQLLGTNPLTSLNSGENS
ncbi:flagellar motor protein MotB [Aeromicrobium sp. IC_218]|uniref:flagellar motor protein MotB n=1 Tax=Aeromicrobium sp. IC_218 TaxID=2545468 RepID=UPI001038A589|nr:flagellar motor protein MotB [Aeromicrobium sp. IC_218]TCI99273.1 flagellar motor protein MotB [Aeromicrobium sp. IC_218]